MTISKMLLAAGAILGICVTAQAQTHYSVTEIGTLPGGSISTALGLNDRGQVVGYSSASINDYGQGFVWSAGVSTSTGMLPKGNWSNATAISNTGIVVGDGDTGSFRPESWAKTSAGMVNIFPNSGGNTHAIFVSDTGFIGGYYTKSLSGWVKSWKAAIWTPDPKDPRRYRTVDLPNIPGIDPKSTSAIPSAFNQSGQAAGYAANDIIGQHACFWNNDSTHSIIDLGVYGDDWSSLAYGMNNLGQVIGTSHPPFGSRAVIWENDSAHTPRELSALPGDNNSEGLAINNAGTAIGYSFASVPGTWDASPSRTVVWQGGAVYDLASLVEPTTGAGWNLTQVTAINNVGQITGIGYHNGTLRGFLLTPLP